MTQATTEGKRELVTRYKFSNEQVAAMPSFQVAALYAFRDYKETAEEVAKWSHVPEGWKAGSRLYVLTKLHSDLMAQMHDHPAGGHFGVDKTHKQVLEYYMWPGSRKDVKAFVQRCLVGVQIKYSMCWLAGLPTPLTSAKAPWQDVTVD